MGLGKTGEKLFGVRRSAFGVEALASLLVTLMESIFLLLRQFNQFSRLQSKQGLDLFKPIQNLQVSKATEMGFIVGYYCQSMRYSGGRDQDVGIADQFTSSVKISIYCGCLHNYGICKR